MGRDRQGAGDLADGAQRIGRLAIVEQRLKILRLIRSAPARGSSDSRSAPGTPAIFVG
jgi:hypothetical protein